MPLAPVARGLIILSSVIVAAGLALYENPQVRDFVYNGRRKLAIALGDLADELHPDAQADFSFDPLGRRRSQRGRASGENSTDAASSGVGTDGEPVRRRRRENAAGEVRIESERAHDAGVSYENVPGELIPSQAIFDADRAEQTKSLVGHDYENPGASAYDDAPEQNMQATVTNLGQAPTNSINDKDLISFADDATNDHAEAGSSHPPQGAVFYTPSLPLTPETEEIDKLSDAGTETGTMMSAGEMSEIGGWSEVGSVSGDEDALLSESRRA